MSRVVRFHEHGGPEQLRIDELDVGSPGEGEVRLRVEAVGLNRAEAMFRAGAYMKALKLPSLIGYEGVGVVEAIGPAVQGFAAGDRVCVMPTYRIGEYGLWADRAIVPARSLIAPPPGLTVVEAASIWMQYFTALAIYEVACDSRRHHSHSGRIKQRRPRGHSACQLGRRRAGGRHPNRRQDGGTQEAGCEACDRNRGIRLGEGGSPHHGR